MLLHEFVPYLKLHNNLSKMEQTAAKALEENSGMTATETAYHTAMKEYVSKCRAMVNSGDYSLPPVPQLKDFDTELATYKEHAKDMQEYGYSWDGMLPLKEEAALHLYTKGNMQIFLLHEDGSESIPGSPEDINAKKGGIWGVYKGGLERPHGVPCHEKGIGGKCAGKRNAPALRDTPAKS